MVVQPLFGVLLEESECAEEDEGDELGFVDRMQQLLGARRSATGMRLAIRLNALAGKRSPVRLDGALDRGRARAPGWSGPDPAEPGMRARSG